ncbi:MAG: asparagine synthase-related protein [Pseudomonadota bacterium]|jgi:asparagine synthase (glutamine-hydrolysing)|uniref:Asparagine synthetase [glutamine-hydrolyzing] n=1 Tax=hydrothermal vent metagenome TaxID=652676 RepID=A0A170PQC4_9ZZZZ
MSGIFGIFVRDGAPGRLAALRGAGRLPQGRAPVFSDATAMLSQERPVEGIRDGDAAVATAGRIHNRLEIARALSLDAAMVSDHRLFTLAYARWGQGCFSRIHGDWSCACWHPAEQRLVLARDHHGNTGLYYHDAPGIFAFATARRDLLALGLAPVEMDELYLAQMLVSWRAYQGDRTIHGPIRRVPPAHALIITPDRIEVQRYWRLEDTPELRVRRDEYVEGLREIFDRAVRERLPDRGGVAATLSGGLDSGSVAVTAAQMLAGSGRRLAAYTSVPLADPSAYAVGGLGDEYALARDTARAAGTIDLHRIDAASVSPIQAIRDMLDIVLEPQHAAGNFFWLLDLYRTAARAGHGVVLTGQLGNGGISWSGGIGALPWRRQISTLGMAGWARRRVRGMLPVRIEQGWRGWRNSGDFGGSAIVPDFAGRLRLSERRAADAEEAPYVSPRLERLRMLLPGRSQVGALHAEMGRAAGLSVGDPTGDARVLAFCLSVPDSVFVDPATGQSRWLIREAMKGRLPETVRLNRRMGIQAADLVPRLRACPAEVGDAIDSIAHGPAAGYVDTTRLEAAWRLLRSEDTPQAYSLAVSVLTRGIMAGLFVNGFGRSW